MSVPKVLPHYDHIPLHRLWAFIRLQTDLTLPEYAHLVDCEDCRIALQTCMEAGSFGAVLKKLKKDGGDDFIAEAS
jgi:hypothetical protein